MYFISSENEKIDWSKEPDIAEFRRLSDLSKSSPESARHGFEKLAERGSIASMLYLASNYVLGYPNKDLDRAKRWYALAASKGDEEACMVYARLCFEDQEYTVAKVAFEKLAQLKDPAALYFLGQIALIENRDDPTKKLGVTFLCQSSDLGYPFATRDLALLKLSGKLGVSEWFKGIALLPRIFFQTFNIFR
jgi:TPR repeat protein